MRPDLLNLLYERYPRLFCSKDGNSSSVTQRPPIEIGDGWFGIVDALCSTLQAIDPETKIIHIRTRFRYLRFRCWPTSPASYGAIHTAQAFSMRICEATGSVFPNVRDISPNEKSFSASFKGGRSDMQFPIGLFDLADIGFKFISKRSSLKSSLPIIQIKTASWDSTRGLILTPSMASIRATTITQIERATMSGTRRGYKGRLDRHLEKIVDRTNAASRFLTEMSKRMDEISGRCGPVDDDGKLLPHQTPY